MKRTSYGLIAIASLSLASCSASTGTEMNDPTPSADIDSSVESSIRETRNVSYQGKVQKAGMSIYMEGTHRLELSDGRFVLLESDDLDLDRYAEKNVAVLGAVRPTTEGENTIMRVEQITLLQQEESSSSSSSEASESSSSEALSSAPESSSSSAVAVATSKAASSIKPAVSSGMRSSIAASSLAAALEPSSSAVSESAQVSSAMPISLEGELATRTAVMANANLADANWTQKYCSTHIGFCFPVHKNWWFKSFGTTSSSLWHVEISTGEMTELGQGPLVVNLMSGGLESTSKRDGGVFPQGEFVIGYAAFNETSHFEVSAPKALEAAVRYIVTHIQEAQ